MAPQGAGEQETAQVTPLLDGSLSTVAVIDAAPPICTAPGWGPCVIETAIAGTVTAAEVDPNGSATEVAATVTVRSLAGGVAGALYVTEVLVGLVRVPAPEAGETVQVTPLCAGSP